MYQGDADTCYIALLGGPCGANVQGGVYKISASWYTNHYGGATSIQAQCGQYVESWVHGAPPCTMDSAVLGLVPSGCGCSMLPFFGQKCATPPWD
jgi:hypothetical protein